MKNMLLTLVLALGVSSVSANCCMNTEHCCRKIDNLCKDLEKCCEKDCDNCRGKVLECCQTMDMCSANCIEKCNMPMMEKLAMPKKHHMEGKRESHKAAAVCSQKPCHKKYCSDKKKCADKKHERMHHHKVEKHDDSMDARS